MFIGGAFPRSESGRTYEAEEQKSPRLAQRRARRRDAARKAQPGWSAATAFNRGQVLYRLAEMLDARAGELTARSSGARRGRTLGRPPSGTRAGPTNKTELGGSNPVSGPYFNSR